MSNVHRVYVEKKDGKARRSAQSAMYIVLSGLTRIIAPMLAYTADEIWQTMPHILPSLLLRRNGETII